MAVDISKGWHTYSGINNRAGAYYIPDEINADTKVIYYHHGPAGYSTGATERYLNYYFTNEEVDPNAIVVCCHGANSWDTEEIMGSMDNMLQNIYNETTMEAPVPVRIGFSASAPHSVVSAAKYVINNPGCDKQIVFANDWAYQGTNNSDISRTILRHDEYVNALIENKTTVVMVEPLYQSTAIDLHTAVPVSGYDRQLAIPSEFLKLQDAGVDVVIAGFKNPSSGSHAYANLSLLTSVMPFITKKDPSIYLNQEDSLVPLIDQSSVKFNVNSDPDMQYEWFRLQDGVLYKTSFSDVCGELVTKSSSNKLLNFLEEHGILKFSDNFSNTLIGSKFNYVIERVCGIKGTIFNGEHLSENGNVKFFKRFGNTGSRLYVNNDEVEQVCNYLKNDVCAQLDVMMQSVDSAYQSVVDYAASSPYPVSVPSSFDKSGAVKAITKAIESSNDSAIKVSNVADAINRYSNGNWNLSSIKQLPDFVTFVAGSSNYDSKLVSSSKISDEEEKFLFS